MDENITSLPEARLRKVFMPAPVTDEQEQVCPLCKNPLASSSHGWLREYTRHDPADAKHRHSERCIRKSGFCMVPCLMCSGGVAAKQQARLINDLFGDAHIPWYAREWTFSSFPQVGDTAALEQVKNFVRLCLDGLEQKRGLYLKGANGLGKTSMAISALQYVIRHGHAGCFITTKELFTLAKEAVGASRRIADGDADYEDRYTATRGAKLYRLVKSVEWLVLDDLGVECGTKYEIGELYLIVEARRAQGLYTIFTSNRDAHDLHLYWRSPRAQEGVYEDSHRVIDRLGEMCLVIPVIGQNHRLQAR